MTNQKPMDSATRESLEISLNALQQATDRLEAKVKADETAKPNK